MEIELKQAQQIAINSQLLSELPDKETPLSIIRRLGYIQIDAINIIERSHHHTFWTRCPDYKPEDLHRMQAVDRTVFEYWGHAASYLPMSDYRYYLPLKKAYHDPHRKWEKERFEKYGHLMQPILHRIRAEGPVSSRDFTPPKGDKKGAWWDWRPTKTALELLFWRGDLMIKERKKIERVYDLTERVLPEDVDTRMPSDEDLGRFLVLRALKAYGVAIEREIFEHIKVGGKKIINDALRQMVESGEVDTVEIAGVEKHRCYAMSETLEKVLNLKPDASQIHLLSPFDNLIIQRERIKRLFDFDYSLECYVPQAKRKYGYFVLPILWGNRFIGRMDPKADRKKKILTVKNLLFEPDISELETALSLLIKKMISMAEFNGCRSVVVENCNNRKIWNFLKKGLS